MKGDRKGKGDERREKNTRGGKRGEGRMGMTGLVEQTEVGKEGKGDT